MKSFLMKLADKSFDKNQMDRASCNLTQVKVFLLSKTNIYDNEKLVSFDLDTSDKEIRNLL